MTAVLAEQPEDWTEQGAFEVVRDVHRIPLPLPLSGLRAVNVYVIEGPAGPVLVDSGWAGADGGALVSGLRSLGHQMADIAAILVTHAHHDHYTQALELRQAHGTKVLLGRGEQPSVDAMKRRQELASPQPALLVAAGAAELAAELAVWSKEEDLADRAPWGEPNVWLDHGQFVPAGGRQLEVFATPGHTRGHIVARDAEIGALFAGDHVLPHITPSIGYERAPEPAPLRSYLDSLRLVRDLPDTVLLPAHGPVTRSVHTRVDELLTHHEERLTAALGQVRVGARTAYAVAAGLPWTRRAKRIDQLETEHASLAVLEIAAHLDVLVHARQLVCAEIEGVNHYALA
ncbi:beta-lactamase (plasmid) [Pseudonocardia sp. EC080610-09]|uniref:MBL fold metallo-hydrolase n=1 Tax=unclassified Pseudonocardia TaxID=2619320 RepID=UPI000705C053|nr:MULTISPECIES: MBL fold metallo-hydrolase [unclassified Pseudonocardia]ALL79710.1 beta-lactamase [Pseudonocardia sp. EC080610-09]ALL85679.1 beta-lactamase [Pseudonocardia sp. EC080619-01]